MACLADEDELVVSRAAGCLSFIATDTLGTGRVPGVLVALLALARSGAQDADAVFVPAL